MTDPTSHERPLGIYLVALYFVVAGFLESIQKYFEAGAPLSLDPFAEVSIWGLVAHTAIYLTLALLVWNFTWLGRLGALVFGYVHLATYLVYASIVYLWDGPAPLTVTPLTVSIAIYHVTALIPVVAYLQPKQQKKVFTVSVLELLFSNE